MLKQDDFHMAMAQHEQGIKRHLRNVLETLFPSFCVGCGTALKAANICHRCQGLLARGSDMRCPVCKKRIPEARVCDSCRKTSALDYFIAAGSYKNPIVKELIHAMKYRFISSHAESLGELLADAVQRVFTNNPRFTNVTALAIPLHRKRLKWRGFNQAELIAAEAALRLGLTLAPSQGKEAWLIRTREGEAQATLDVGKRWTNIAGAFTVSKPDIVKGKRILLIDDVFTSGATIGEAAKTLRRAGAKEIWGAVVARG